MTGHVDTTEWQRLAACWSARPELFFSGEVSAALRVCSVCTVRLPCLDDALAKGDDHGVRGGLSGGQRLELRRLLGSAP